MQTEANNETSVPVIAADATPETSAPVTVAADKPKRARKPRGEAKREAPAKAADKAAKRSKPNGKPSKPERAAAPDRAPVIGKLRAAVAAHYSGPSLPVRATARVVASGPYAELLANPKHRTSRDRISQRDNSMLRLLAANGGATPNGFDPGALNVDRGVFSRLASVGFIEAANKPGHFRFTADGRAAAKRAGAAPAKAA